MEKKEGKRGKKGRGGQKKGRKKGGKRERKEELGGSDQDGERRAVCSACTTHVNMYVIARIATLATIKKT